MKEPEKSVLPLEPVVGGLAELVLGRGNSSLNATLQSNWHSPEDAAAPSGAELAVLGAEPDAALAVLGAEPDAALAAAGVMITTSPLPAMLESDAGGGGTLSM
jgi:hypothetical protein